MAHILSSSVCSSFGALVMMTLLTTAPHFCFKIWSDIMKQDRVSFRGYFWAEISHHAADVYLRSDIPAFLIVGM